MTAPKSLAVEPQPRGPGARPLTAKQRRFVEEYLIDLNATQAAHRAGYSARTAMEQGHQLLQKASVQEAVQAAMAARSERTGITADQVLEELAKVGFANLSDVTNWGTKEVAIGFDGDGKRLAPEDVGDAVVVHYVEAPFITPICRDDLPPKVRAAVSEVVLTKEGFRVKMHDKVAALVQIGRHLGMFVDRMKHEGEVVVRKALLEMADD